MVFTYLKSILLVGARFERAKKLVALLGQNRPLERSNKDRDAISFHLMKFFQNSLQALVHFPKLRLLIVERIEQAEDHRCFRFHPMEEFRKSPRDGCLHLVARESAGDVNMIEERLRVGVLLAEDSGKIVGIKSVGAIDDGKGLMTAEDFRCNKE
jgi:hypothetical protein